MDVCFSLDNPKREVSTIRGFISYSGQRYDFPTGERVKVKMFKNQHCKASPEAPAINNKLTAVESAMKSSILYFKQDFKVPTKEEFREKVRLFMEGNNNIQVKRNDKLFVNYIEKYIEKSKKSERTKKGYTTTLNKLIEYQNYKGIQLTFDDINLKFEEEFRNWMYESSYIENKIEKKYSRNYIGFLFKNIILFMKEAKEKDELHNNIKYKQFLSDKEKADTIALRIEELEKIHKIEITAELLRSYRKDRREQNIEVAVKALNITKNKFLIGAFCAMRISDFNRINSTNIHEDTISIMPKKGSSLKKPEPVVLPMHPIVKEILENGFDYNYKMSEQKFNKHIKIVCKLAGLTDKVIIYRTEGGELQEKTFEKWEKISSHTARRSGATNMWLAGMPVELIMACGGWSKKEQCEDYIKASASEKLKALKESNFFIGWQNKIKIKDVSKEWIIIQMNKHNMTISGIADKLSISESIVNEVLEQDELDIWQKTAFYYLLS